MEGKGGMILVYEIYNYDDLYIIFTYIFVYIYIICLEYVQNMFLGIFPIYDMTSESIVCKKSANQKI